MTEAIKAEGTEVLENEVVNADGLTTKPAGDGVELGGEGGVLAVAFGADPSPGPDAEDDNIEVDGQKIPAPPWVKTLREEQKKTKARNAELEAENVRLKTPRADEPALVVVGEKPSFEICGFDEAKFQTELEAWHDRKRQAEKQDEERASKEQKRKDAEAAKHAVYLKERASITAPDVEATEQVALTKLSVLQQNLVLAGCKKPALFIYALGKTPAKLNELAAINDPVQFLAESVRLETELRTKTVKPGMKPESRVSGNASTTATVDKKLDSLRAEAEKTGNYTAVNKYKSELRAASGKR